MVVFLAFALVLIAMMFLGFLFRRNQFQKLPKIVKQIGIKHILGLGDLPVEYRVGVQGL